MKIKGVMIAPSAMRKMRALAKLSGRFESGGPMVGFVENTGVLVVTDVAGPGPKGRCMPYSVTIDGNSAQEFCDLAYRDSDGLIDFVGDWHSHPSFSVHPSSGDREAMSLLAATPGLVSNPVSLIYSSWVGRYKVYEWIREKDALVSIPILKFKKFS